MYSWYYVDNMHYFAYGSNLSHSQMASRCPESKYIGVATLDDYKFVYDGYAEVRQGAVANIVPSENERTTGAVYEVSDEDLRRLDIFEEVPLGTYHRVELDVTMRDSGERITATTYLRDTLPEGEPSPDYVAVIEQGKKDCGIKEKVEV